jgi:hypothetical protein
VKISLKDDSLPDDTELYVRGLGMLVNGKTVEFSQEDIDAFETETGVKLANAFKNDPRVTLSGTGSRGGDD